MEDDLKKLLIYAALGIIALVVCVFMASAFYTWQNPPEVNVFLSGIGQGGLSILTLAAAFYFGSSRSSQAKDKVIETLTGNGAPK